VTLPAGFESSFSTIGYIVVAMAVVALVEVLVPLHVRGRWNRAHLGPNLALTSITFATNFFLNVGLLALVVWLESKGLGVLRWLSIPPLPAALLAVAALDLSFYAAHVSWHEIPSLWRFHAVHHSDPAVDVTTTVRQHPVEGLLRYAALAAMAVLVGPSPAAFAVYRAASALNALLEHANLRMPRRLDGLLSLVTTWPHMHKVHHSRNPEQTDTNYGNLFSIWDRLFGTFTPSHQGTRIAYGLDGFDRPEIQTTTGLLALPFRAMWRSPGAARAAVTPAGPSVVRSASRAPAARRG
jgi:sterol desaturase/sphingolipid hydroxylase (fatty acid hydroxylase superfamily)